MLKIRPERQEDTDRISYINLEAFEDDTEPNLVEAIRRSEYFIPELSLVAELDGQLIGHILFSEIAVCSANQIYTALTLAPMAVLPEFQNRGVGSALVRRGLEEVKKSKYKIVIVIGHPGYYPRFGFKPARERGLEVKFDVPDEAFMVLEVESGALKNVNGTIRFPTAFESAIRR